MKINDKDNNIIFIGNIYGEHLCGGHAGSVFAIDGICPTIKTCQGGNTEPMIIENDYIINKKTR